MDHHLQFVDSLLDREVDKPFDEQLQKELKEAATTEQSSLTRQMIMDELSEEVQSMHEDTFHVLYEYLDTLFQEHVLDPFSKMERYIDNRIQKGVADAIRKHENKEEEVIRNLNQRVDDSTATVQQMRNEMNSIAECYRVRFNEICQEVNSFHDKLKHNQGVGKSYTECLLEKRAGSIEQQIGEIRDQALKERKDISKLLEEVFILPAEHKSELGVSYNVTWLKIFSIINRKMILLNCLFHLH